MFKIKTRLRIHGSMKDWATYDCSKRNISKQYKQQKKSFSPIPHSSGGYDPFKIKANKYSYFIQRLLGLNTANKKGALPHTPQIT